MTNTPWNVKTKTRRLRSGLLFLVVAATFICVAGCFQSQFHEPAQAQSQPPKLIATADDGKLYQAGDFRVAVVRGTWYEMGRQYGELLADDIQAVATLTSVALVQMAGAEQAKQGRELVRSQIDLYPKRFRDMLDGMAEGSGLTIEEIAMAEHVVSILVAVQEGLFCSSITTWGDYTTDGQLVMGRNFDYPPMYRALAPHLCVVVFHPIDGSVPTAIFGYAGQICCVQAFNRDGLVLELNVALGLPAPEQTVKIDRITMPLLVTQLAFDSSTMTQLDAGMKTMRSNAPLLNTVADTQSACTYELGTGHVVKRAIDRDGLNTATNFVYDAFWQSRRDDSRRGNLQTLAEKHKGKVDFETMKKIIATPAGKGGAWSDWGTIYQFVYEPATRRLSLRTCGPDAPADWTELDLGWFFGE